MIQRIFFLLLISIFSIQGYAQYYEHSAGFRLGGSTGITYKVFMNNNQSLETLLSGRQSGVQATLLYEFYKPLRLGKFDTFFFYYGPGGHVGIEQHPTDIIIFNDQAIPQLISEERTQYVMGIDFIGGIEYRLISVPLVIGFDIKPYFNFIGMRKAEVDFWDSSLTLKYAF